MKKKLIISILFLSIICNSYAHFDFNPQCRKAYTLTLSMRFAEAKKILDAEKIISPSNDIPYYIDNYIDVLSIIVNQDKNTYNKLINNKDARLKRLEKADKNSPYYNCCLADYYLLWAIARLVFIDNITNVVEGLKAGVEIKKAYSLLDKNNKMYPDFIPNLKGLGLMHALIDAVPDNYKSVIQAIAFKGTIKQGVSEIKTLLDASINNEKYDYLRTEALFLLSNIQINLSGNKKEALALKKYYQHPKLVELVKTNPMLCVSEAKIDVYNGLNDEAITLLTTCPAGSQYYPFYTPGYLAGISKLNRLDKDAYRYFFDYVEKTPCHNYIKSSLQHIAWFYLLNNDEKKYKEYMQRILKSGDNIVEIDKQAQREAENKDIPNVVLLKARLLCDGGYYQLALNVLQDNAKKLNLKNKKDTLELYYRYARIYHEWDKIENAYSFYERTIREGSNQVYYFAANSALQLGLIYENKKEYRKARLYYERCLTLNPNEYKTSIQQKAKVGLSRIKGL